jgi:L-lactate dehydrogenase complex protein LldG
MSSREAILEAVRANKPCGEYPLPALPNFPMEGADDRLVVFLRNLGMMGGSGLSNVDVSRLLQERFPSAMVVASTVPEYEGSLDLRYVVRPQDLAGVDVAIVRGRFGVAETGSVLLTDDALVLNALAYLAQHLVVLLDPAEIVPTLQEAYQRVEFRRQRYASFHTGPSATADIEGVLIHGAQGVRSLTVLIAGAPTP